MKRFLKKECEIQLHTLIIHKAFLSSTKPSNESEDVMSKHKKLGLLRIRGVLMILLFSQTSKTAQSLKHEGFQQTL